MTKTKEELEGILVQAETYLTTAYSKFENMTAPKLGSLVWIQGLLQLKREELETFASLSEAEKTRALNALEESLATIIERINALEGQEIIPPLVRTSPVKDLIKPQHPVTPPQREQKPDYVAIIQNDIDKAIRTFYEAIPQGTAETLSKREQAINTSALELHSKLKGLTERFVQRKINHSDLQRELDGIYKEAEKSAITKVPSLWQAFVNCLISIVNTIVKYTLGQIEGGPQRLFSDPQTPKLLHAFKEMKDHLERTLDKDKPLMKGAIGKDDQLKENPSPKR